MSKKGNELTRTADQDLVADDDETGASLRKGAMTQDERRALLADGYEVEKFLSIPEGEAIEGYFLGAGTAVLMNDPSNRENGQRAVGTWRFKHPVANVIQVIATSAQLDARLPSIPLGCHCVVEKIGQTSSGGRRVNNWNVYHSTKRKIDIAPKTAAQPVNGAVSFSTPVA